MKTHTKFLGVLINIWHLKSIVDSSKEKLHEALASCIKVKNILIRNRYWICIMHSYTHILRIALLYGVILFRIFLTRLWNCRKGAERLVEGAGKYDYTAPIFEKYELLNLRNLYLYCAQIFLYKHHQEILPEVFSHFFEINNAVREHYTRQEKHFHVPLCKSVQKSKCLKCFGVTIYNYMIEHMNYNCSFVSFKYVL